MGLNLSKVQSYSIFPGQIVVAQGTNVNGSQFIAHNIYSDAAYALPPAPENLQQLQGEFVKSASKIDVKLVDV